MWSWWMMRGITERLMLLALFGLWWVNEVEVWSWTSKKYMCEALLIILEILSVVWLSSWDDEILDWFLISYKKNIVSIVWKNCNNK